MHLACRDLAGRQARQEQIAGQQFKLSFISNDTA
jgi:hypothetical protein